MKFADKPFALVGVNSDPDLDEIRKVVKEKKITWRSFWNGPSGTSGPISDKWNVLNWPVSYVIDAEGVIRFKNLNDARLEQAIEDLLAEATGSGEDGDARPAKGDGGR